MRAMQMHTNKKEASEMKRGATSAVRPRFQTARQLCEKEQGLAAEAQRPEVPDCRATAGRT